MTREEQKYIKEASKALEAIIKKKSKEYGYKTISGIVYKFVGEFVYIALISVFPVDLGKKITVNLCFKPVVLDELFWEIFEVTEAKKMPKSFHVNGAFTIPMMEVATWKVPVASIENIEDHYKKIAIEMDRQISSLQQTVPNLSSFILYTKKERNSSFYSILASTHKQQYANALELIGVELAKNETSPFLDSRGKNFYDFAKNYCEARI